MKKIKIFICVAMAASLATADNYFFIGDGGKLRIRPDYLYSDINIPVSAHFDGRLDKWRLEFTHPTTLCYNSAAEGPGMTIHYQYVDGSDTICTATLTDERFDNMHVAFSSEITEFGYWDHNNDGIYEPYGTVKWGPGDYDTMFTINFGILGDCTGDTITISGNLSSTYDWRGGVVNTTFVKKFALVVGYDPGDVNGDYLVDMDDMTALLNYLMNNQGLNAYQLVGADLNGDGQVDMDDLTLLINLLLSNGTMSPDELEDILNGGTQMY